MADEMIPMEQQTTQEMPQIPQSAPEGGSSKRSTIALLAGAVLLGVVLAIVLFFVFGRDSSPPSGNAVAEQPGSAVAQTSQSATSAPVAGAAVTPVEPAEVPLTDVFTFRDIFEPLVKPASTSGTGGEGSGEATSTGGGGGSTEETETTSAENTLLLQDITVEDGEATAVLVWNGVTYDAHEGDQIDDSPWQVLEIRDSSVVMLFGDTQVVLSVGQAVSK